MFLCCINWLAGSMAGPLTRFLRGWLVRRSQYISLPGLALLCGVSMVQEESSVFMHFRRASSLFFYKPRSACRYLP